MPTALRKTCLGFALAFSVNAQDWEPTRIVAITDYVPLAAQARISGDVLIRCTLASDGSVLSADFLSGKRLLAAQARENALQWRFRHSKAGKNRDNAITLTHRYRLDGDSKDRSEASFTVDLPDEVTIIAPVIYVQP